MIGGFLKTLVGDRNTVLAAAVIVVSELLLLRTGFAGLATLLVPLLVLGAVAWLAPR